MHSNQTTLLIWKEKLEGRGKDEDKRRKNEIYVNLRPTKLSKSLCEVWRALKNSVTHRGINPL